MSLTKWFRKNNRKIMAIFVVAIMIAFIGGQSFQYFFKNSANPSKAVALYSKDKEITLKDFFEAEQELNILQAIRADQLLKTASKRNQYTNRVESYVHGVKGLMLHELLFSDNTPTPQMVNEIKRLVMEQQLQITDRDILSLYQKQHQNKIYWALLKKEAQNSGIFITNDIALMELQQVLPFLFGGASYPDIINRLIQGGFTEESIQSAYSTLLSIIQYSRKICQQEPLTIPQLTKTISYEYQPMSIKYVPFSARLFLDKQPEPSEKQIIDHFQKYKNYLPGELSKDNQYGFGYKLNDMVSFEYIILKFEDVEKIIPPVTQQEKERFYQANTEMFRSQRPIDPNDPNSLLEEYTLTFGQVAKQISTELKNQRLNEKAQSIISEAKLLTEKPFSELDRDANSTQLRAVATDYSAIAGEISRKFALPVYSGKTGLLDMMDIQKSDYLYDLFLRPASSAKLPSSISELLFTARELGENTLQKPLSENIKLFENAGPLNNRKIIALIRVVETKKSLVPKNIEMTVSKKGLVLDEQKPEDETFKVKDLVIKDLRKLSAINTAKKRAEEFLKIAKDQQWELAIDQFNKQYPPNEPNEPNNFDFVDYSRLNNTNRHLANIKNTQDMIDPGMKFAEIAQLNRIEIVNSLFSNIPNDSNQPKELPFIIEMKPTMEVFCVKEMSINRIDQNRYLREKAQVSFWTAEKQHQSLSAVLLNPENIIKRTNFRYIQKDEDKEKDPNVPADTNESQDK